MTILQFDVIRNPMPASARTNRFSFAFSTGGSTISEHAFWHH